MRWGDILVAAAGLMIGGGILLAERRRPLRQQTRPALRRNLRNAALGAGCAIVVAAVEVPLTRRIAAGNARHGRGFAQLLPRPLRPIGAIAGMDYGFYWWHVATHKVPCLWRFHRVHHVDRDMDASTAIRFHPLDMLVSLPWRLAQVRLSGADPRALVMWRHFFNASILFHHSNWRLPGRLDAMLSRIVTTPEMHGIHHSRIRSQRDSNYTSGLSIWDRLHGTFRSTPPPERIVIGVAERATRDDMPIGPALTAPFHPTPASLPPTGR
ncbi:MAG: sterol desaturase family protein [Pontixanthobacter sp.]